MNNLLIVGCSMFYRAYDDEMPRRRSTRYFLKDYTSDRDFKRFLLDKTFGHFLAEKIGTTVTNLSEEGQSNWTSIRKAYNYVQQATQKPYIILGITEPGRFNLWNTQTEWQNFFKFNLLRDENWWENWLQNGVSSKARLSSRELAKLGEEFNRYFCSYSHFVRDLNTQVELFRTYCKANSIPLLLIDSINNLRFEYDICRTHFMKFPEDTYCWREWIHSYDYVYNGGHPNTDDHEKLATYLHDRFFS